MSEIGRITAIGIGKETTFGTKASAINFFPVESFDPAPRTDVVRESGIFGRKESTRKGACVAKKYAEPTFDGLVYDEIIGEMLMAALGVDTISGAGVPYSHVFTSLNTGIPSYTIVWKDGNMTKMLTGCVLGSLEINQETGEFLKYSAAFMSTYPETTTDTVSIPTENKFCSKFATVKIADTVAALAASGAIGAESFRISIEKNVEGKYVFGSNEPSTIHDKQLDVNGEFMLDMDAGTYLDLNEAGTTKAIQLETVNTDVTIGTGNPEILFVLDAVDIQEWTRNGGKDDRVTQTCGFTASYDPDTSSEITVTLKNSQSTEY